MRTVETRDDRSEAFNYMYLLALRSINYKGKDDEVIQRARRQGKEILWAMAQDKPDVILLRPRGCTPYPMEVNVDIASCDPLEFMAMVAGVASHAGEWIVRHVEIGWGRMEEGKLKLVYMIDNGNLRRRNGVDDLLTSLRDTGITDCKGWFRGNR